MVREPGPACTGWSRTASGRTACAARAAASSRRCGWSRTAPAACGRHERTLAGPKAGRLALLRALRANLSPIFAVYDDP